MSNYMCLLCEKCLYRSLAQMCAGNLSSIPNSIEGHVQDMPAFTPPPCAETVPPVLTTPQPSSHSLRQLWGCQVTRQTHRLCGAAAALGRPKRHKGSKACTDRMIMISGWRPAGALRLRVVVGLLAVGRAVAAGAEQGAEQSFLAWLWALLGGDAGPLLTQLEADAEVDDAYMICMTEVR